MAEFTLGREGVRLGGLEFGGTGPGVLLLHGLAGYAGEWRATADRLTDCSRVVALDARGHGVSERHPQDVSLSAHAADAASAIEELGLAPAVVVGQSLGGQTAILLAAHRPDLVRGLVVAEADPDTGDEQTASEVEDWLSSWPVPFASREQAAPFFGGSPERARTWANGLERLPDGWVPRFEIDVMARTLREAVSRSYWSDWERIQCPALVVRGQDGDVSGAVAAAMVDRLPNARLIELAGAGHDLHLDQPEEWRALIRSFVELLESSPS